jgi:diguanylate cyclase (GGDEF)-like protein
MFRRMSQKNRVLALIAGLAMATFALGAGVFVLARTQSTEIAAMSTRLALLRSVADDLTIQMNQAEAALGDFVVSGTLLARQRFDDAIAAAGAAEDELLSTSADLDTFQASLERVGIANQAWRDRIADPAIRAVETGDAAALEVYEVQSINDRDAIDAAIGSLDRELGRTSAAIEQKRDEGQVITLMGTALAFWFLIMAFGVAIVAVRRFGQALERDAGDASVLNRFTEVTSFADDDRLVATANLVALDRLARPDASVIHILNRSLDRAIPEASTGEAIANILPMHELGRCAGVQRGALYVSRDLSDELSVHCPIYPATTGTLVCIPLNSGESVGAVHLYWHQPHELPLERRSGMSRITEHAALSIGNRRLMAALHGQANTDARTGLANSRAFDLALQSALEVRSGNEALSVLMLDVDHFKDFNDRHGHPAGDEALRAFANTLRSCMREADVAARYGGEEFAVLLPGIDHAAALAIAERIRARTEATIISLAPGQTDRITVSAGVASAPDHGQDRVTLLRLADQALYVAKATGRNRVASVNESGSSAASDELGLAS